MQLFLIIIAVSVLLFLLKKRKKVTFDNIADFLERVTNSMRKKRQPLHIVISDPEGIVVAKAVHCYDIKEMYNVPRNMPGLCPVCHNTIEKIPNLDYYTSTDKDIAITYDGFYIVRDRFKLFCERQGYEGLRFVPLKNSLRHFYFMPEKIFQMDKKTTVTMHQGDHALSAEIICGQERVVIRFLVQSIGETTMTLLCVQKNYIQISTENHQLSLSV